MLEEHSIVASNLSLNAKGKILNAIQYFGIEFAIEFYGYNTNRFSINCN